MKTKSVGTADEQEIATLIDRRKTGHRDKDAAAITAPYAPDVIIYDLAPPLLHRGIQTSEVEQWLSSWEGPITIDTEALNVSVDGALAVAWGLSRMRGRQGEVDQDLWYRTTIVLQKVDGRWQIAHEHASVPFYMDGSYRAATDLKPAA
jgi:ketosteroid isomerase-like protein